MNIYSSTNFGKSSNRQQSPSRNVQQNTELRSENMNSIARSQGWSDANRGSDNRGGYVEQIGMSANQQNYSGWDSANVTQNYERNHSYTADNQYNQYQPQQRQMSQEQVQQNQLWDLLSQIPGLSYQINSVFERPLRQYKFPSPYIKYKIVPMLNEKKCLDVTTVNNEKKNLKKNNLIIWDYHGGPNQQYYIKEGDSKDRYYIVNVSKGFTVQIPESSQKSGENIVINPRNDTPNELWELLPSSHGSFQIRGCNGKVLDVFEQSTKNGTPVIQWPSNGQKNQKWRIVPA